MTCCNSAHGSILSGTRTACHGKFETGTLFSPITFPPHGKFITFNMKDLLLSDCPKFFDISTMSKYCPGQWKQPFGVPSQPQARARLTKLSHGVGGVKWPDVDTIHAYNLDHCTIVTSLDRI